MEYDWNCQAHCQYCKNEDCTGSCEAYEELIELERRNAADLDRND